MYRGVSLPLAQLARREGIVLKTVCRERTDFRWRGATSVSVDVRRWLMARNQQS